MNTTPSLSGAARDLPLAALLAFESVAGHLNFARAAAELRVTPTAVSRTIKLLEAQLKTRLFNRTTRSVALTEAGTQLLASIKPALEQIRSSIAQAGRDSDEPMGILRINVSYVAYRILLEPHLDGFLQRYPHINVEIALDNRLTDVVREGFDAGIRFGHAVQRDMIAVVMGPAQRRTVVAAPSYLERHGAPATPEALLRHNCIRQRFPASERLFEWRFQHGGKQVQIDVQGRVMYDEMPAVLDAAVHGLGIGYVFEHFAQDALERGAVTPLLEKYRLPGESFYLYYPNRAHMPAKLRAFIDHMQAAQKTDKGMRK
jgi:DNA-binding transcriptional LysR family regulator